MVVPVLGSRQPRDFDHHECVDSRSGDLNAQIAAQTPFFVLSGIVGLALFLPTLGVTVRRLHDTNRSGGWWWIQLIPFVGSIILLVFMFLPSIDQGNRFND